MSIKQNRKFKRHEYLSRAFYGNNTQKRFYG